MNAVEIEEAVSQLAEAPFDPEEFPFAFLEAFGNKKTTIKRLKSQRNSTNKSDLDGVLQRNNIHIKVCLEGEVTDTLTALRESPATAKQKAKFILATDGKSLEAENLADGETIVCDYPEFHNHFGFFLPLAGITTVKQIRENAFDIKATGRLNKLYVELLNENPDWDSAERREELNHLMARLIFCFFAEDTNIFYSNNLFTDTIAQMSAGDSSNTHEVLSELFRAMATPLKQREKAGIRNWANGFPYVNGGLFSPHPLTPSPLSPSGRGAGGEGNSLGKYPHPLAPSPKQGEGGQETMSEGKYWEIPPALKKKMTEQNKTDLTRCAEDILLAREQYFPATIADMYDPERMDKEFPLVQEAHERNDEVLERIYIGRRFKNDTERLEKLFELYTKMTAPKSS